MAGDIAGKSMSGMQTATIVAGGGLTLASIAGYFSLPSMQPFFMIMLIGLIAAALIVALYKFFLSRRDKSKSGPFAKLLSRNSGTTIDPATKARMDDLRKKFEEGVETFKKAGKDLYTLPWFLLVGPSGSGKTEALRHSNIGFPQGLQDCFQGSGGTLNMHWWFTNQAVVLDTAGRMFMQDVESGQSEWKEFLKLLKLSRPNCPINGMLLVISSENLLKDSAEKIDATAGIIARQLDLIQRTLDVRFPVTVLVTKCDKIVGFREFFESLTDPIMKHQMLGWSNPSGLDEAFKPETLDKHLGDVRLRLMKRRMGLLQNPIHTMDPSDRRTDQVDELFELPDNFMRIAPRLRSYLEKIFVAGEWSPKPLFLRGIYFTSSMREGQALDMSLAQALGVEVESLAGGRDWDRDSAYFLRDTFLSKVFKEKGLVTRATNVNKQLAKQKMTVLTVVGVTLLMFLAISFWGYRSFNSSLQKPKDFWTSADRLINGKLRGEDPSNVPLKMFEPVKGEGAKYTGNVKFNAEGGPLAGEDVPAGLGTYLGDAVDTPAEVIAQTTANTGEIPVPLIAKPVISSLGGASQLQVAAHREVVQRNVVAALLEETRIRLNTERLWNNDAVAALAEMARLQTYSLGLKPADNLLKESSGKTTSRPVVDVDVLFKYVLSPAEYGKYQNDRPIFTDAVAKAYPNGFDKDNRPAKVLFDPANHTGNIVAAVGQMRDFYSNLEFDPQSELGLVQNIVRDLTALETAEKDLWAQRFFGKDSADERNWLPKTMEDYDGDFAGKFDTAMKTLREAQGKLAVSLNDKRLKEAYSGNPAEMLKKAGNRRTLDLDQQLTQLIDQLPPPPATTEDGKSDSKTASENATIADLRASLLASKSTLSANLQQKLAALDGQLKGVLPALVASSNDVKAFETRMTMYAEAEAAIAAAAAPAASEAGATRDFAEVLGRATKDFDDRKSAVARAVTAWTASSTSLASLGLTEADAKPKWTERAENAERVSKKAVDIAATRARYEAAKSRIAAFPADNIGEFIKANAGRFIDEAGSGSYNKPKIPFTTMNDDSQEFDRNYHPGAVRKLLADVATIEEIVSPGARATPGNATPPMLEQRKIAADLSNVKSNFDQYVSEYGRYWRRVVENDAVPKIETWQQFQSEVSSVDPYRVNDRLAKVYDIASEAVEKLPESAKRLSAIKECQTAISGYFSDERFRAPDKREKFSDGCSETLSVWRSLAGGDAKRARDTLIGALGASRFDTNRKKYFGPVTGDSVKYWRELVTQAVITLAAETGDTVAKNWNRVFVEAKRVPLARGPGLAELTAQQVAELGDIAKALEVAPEPGARAGDSEIPPIDSAVDPAIRQMAGGDVLTSPERRKLLTEVRKLAAGLGGGKVTVEFKCPPYIEGNLGNGFADGTLISGDMRAAIGKVNQESLVVDPRQIAARRMVLPTAVPYRIELADPKGATRTVSLSSSWPLLAEALLGGQLQPDGWVLTKVPASDGSGELSLLVKWSEEDGVPSWKDWLDASKWPK